MRERFAKKGLDKIEKRGVGYFLSVQNELEKCLQELQKRLNLRVLRLDGRESIGVLHEKIKEFIDG